MKFSFHEPHHALKPYIKGYFDMECFENTGIHFKPLPDIYFEIGLFYNGSFIKKGNTNSEHLNSYIGGLPLESNYKCTHKGIPCCITIYFQPGGFYNLFGIPSSEISEPVDFESVFGNSGKELIEKIKNAETSKERIQKTDSYFLKFLDKRYKYINPFYSTVANIIQTKSGCITIRQLCQELNITKRKLDRNFKNSIGAKPKEFARVVRFNRIFDICLKMNEFDAHDIVFGFGFYDQSHLINEFKDFVNCSPGKFFKNKNKYLLSVYRKFLVC